MQVGDALLELVDGSAGEDAIEAQSSARSNGGASIDSSPDSSSDVELENKHQPSRSKQEARPFDCSSCMMMLSIASRSADAALKRSRMLVFTIP